MQEVIHELFTEEELKIYDEERLNLSLKKVIGDLEDRKINFYSLGNDQFYREILPRYFKWQGYGYLGNTSLHILKDYMLKDRDLADTSLALLLLDTGIIKSIPVTEKNPLETESVIKYKRSKGLKEKIVISYDVLDRFPFYIKEIQCGHKNIINMEVDNEGSRKKVTLNIDIPANDHVTYNFTESLIIYTDFEIKVIDFSIICDTKVSEDIKSVDDFNSFLKLIKINRKSAKNIFNNEDGFKAFLEQNGDIEQILNYEDCKEVAAEVDNYPFSLFCDLNEINKEDLFTNAFNHRYVLDKENYKEEKEEREEIINKDEIEKGNEDKENIISFKERNKILQYEDIKAQSIESESTEHKNIESKNTENISIEEKKDIVYNELENNDNKGIKEDIKIDREIIKPLEKYKFNEEKIKNEVKDEIKDEVESSYRRNDRGYAFTKEKERIEKNLREKDNTISLEYMGKIDKIKKDGIKYNTELLAKGKNNSLDKNDSLDENNILQYIDIKSKREEKHIPKKQDYKKEELFKNKQPNKNELSHRIKKVDNKELDELIVPELQRNNKYKITKKDNKEASKKDMNIVDKIKGMLKGFKRD